MKSAADGDREGVLKHSKELGFFTGYESKVKSKRFATRRKHHELMSFADHGRSARRCHYAPW